MKKLISMIIIISFIFALCACGGANTTQVDVHNHNDPSHTHEEDTTVHTHETVPVTEPVVPGVNDDDKSETNLPIDVTGHYQDNYKNKIAVPCADELMKAQSDASKIVIYDTYAQEWKEVGERFNTELLKIKGTVPATADYSTDEEMHEYLEFCLQEWKDFVAKRTSDFEAMMIEGGDNTGVNLMLSQVIYEINREYALYFIKTYEDIESFSNQGN